MATDCVDTRICFSRDDLASLAKNLISLLKQDSTSGSGSGNGSGSSSGKGKVFTQLMQDMASLSQVERPLSTGTVLNNVLTYYTNNVLQLFLIEMLLNSIGWELHDYIFLH